MAVVKSEFGVASTGEQVYKFKIENSKGEYVSIINYGCTIQAIVVEGKDGKLHDVVLGYDTVKGYEEGTFFYVYQLARREFCALLHYIHQGRQARTCACEAECSEVDELAEGTVGGTAPLLHHKFGEKIGT